MQFLVEWVQGTRVAALNNQLLVASDCLKQLGLLSTGLSNEVMSLLLFELSLFSLTQLIDLLLLKSFLDLTATASQTFFHHGELTFVFLFVGT